MSSSPEIRTSGRPALRLPRLPRWLLPPPDAGSRWWRLVRGPVVILFVLLGLLTIAGALVVHVEGIISESWPTTTGHIIESTINESRKSVRRDSSRRTLTFYTPQVRYTYTVDGQTHEGDRIALELITYGTREDAAAITARFPVGAPVTVAYDPARPERAVLEPGRDGSDTIWGLVVGVGAIGGGLLFLRFGHVRPLQSRRR